MGSEQSFTGLCCVHWAACATHVLKELVYSGGGNLRVRSGHLHVRAALLL
jgi:hypothetical protein